MTWTYDATSRTTRNRVRERIGDVSSTDEQLANEIIDELLDDVDDNVVRASVACIRLILARIARDASRSAVGVSQDMDPVTNHYRALLVELEREAGGASRVYAGGLSIAESDSNLENTDYPAPAFRSGMGRNL